MTPAQRFNKLRKKGLCMQCLYPGAKGYYGKHKEGKCQRDFVCTHIDHQKYPQKKHVLICDEYKMDEANKDVFQKHKRKCILRNKRIHDLPTYAKEIKLAYLGTTDQNSSHLPMNSVSNEEERGIYQLQTITIENQNFTIFYDSGCGDFVSKWSAIQKLGTRAHQEHSGPIKVGGVGGLSTESPFGIYSVNLPLHNGRNTLLSGVCLAKITDDLPQYPLREQVENDIQNAYLESGGNIEDLPKLPEMVGGKINFIIGIKYLRYHPEKTFQMLLGLTIYKSVFKNLDGSRGVVGIHIKFFRKLKGIFI